MILTFASTFLFQSLATIKEDIALSSPNFSLSHIFAACRAL